MAAISWLNIENSFPTFLDGESPQQQIKKLQDYMFKLTDQLKYSLQNLDTSNWNKAALDKFTEDTASGMLQEVKQFASELTRVQSQAVELSGRISGLGNRLTSSEEEITYLQRQMEQSKEDVQQLQENVAGMQQRVSELENESNDAQQQLTGLQAEQDEHNKRLEAQEGVVKPGKDEDTVGNVGRVLNLIGTVYLNGVLLETRGEGDEIT